MAESPSEIAGAVCLAISVFAASLVPWLLLVNAECLIPAWLRATPAAAREAYARAALSAAALLLILSARQGVAR